MYVWACMRVPTQCMDSIFYFCPYFSETESLLEPGLHQFLYTRWPEPLASSCLISLLLNLLAPATFSAFSLNQFLMLLWQGFFLTDPHAQISILTFLKLYLFTDAYLCACWQAFHWWMCWGQRTICRAQVSLFTICVRGIEFSWAVLMADVFKWTHRCFQWGSTQPSMENFFGSYCLPVRVSMKASRERQQRLCISSVELVFQVLFYL